VDVTERWINLDLAAVVATAKTDVIRDLIGPDAANRLASIDRESVDWDAVMTQINSVFDDAVTAMHQTRLRAMMQATQSLARRIVRDEPSQGQSLRRLADETPSAYSRRVGQAILMIWPTERADRVVEEDARKTAMETAMAKAVLAAAKIKAETGKWPAELPDSPRDIYSQDEAQAFQYEIVAGGVRVYSVGPNGVDDGGLTDANNGWDDIAVGVK
jgi:hypothetical protein